MATNETKFPGIMTPPGKQTEGIIYNAMGGNSRDKGDQTRLRQGRERHEGFPIGKYLQAPPFFFTRDGHAHYIVDKYRGATAFLIAGGPSFGDLDHSLLKQPGIMTMGLNNSVKTFRPDMWSCVDDPTNFIRSIWLDPKIDKYVPFDHAEKRIFDSDKWMIMKKKVGDCPNVYFYRRNEHFVADQFLFEDTINWGDHKDFGGGRSCMMATLRILFLLGFRKVFLLGVDFTMSENVKYHFEQDRAKGSINGNNSTYKLLKKRFAALRPIFENHGYHVYNCNEKSNLQAFDYVSYEEAVKMSLNDNLPVDLQLENTKNLYDRKAKEESGELSAAPLEEDLEKSPSQKKENCGSCVRNERKQRLDKVIAQVNTARANLNDAKKTVVDMETRPDDDPIKKDQNEYQKNLQDAKNKVIVCRSIFNNFIKIREDIKTQIGA